MDYPATVDHPSLRNNKFSRVSSARSKKSILEFNNEEKNVLSEVPDLKIMLNLSKKAAQLNKKFFQKRLDNLDAEWIKSIKVTDNFVSELPCTKKPHFPRFPPSSKILNKTSSRNKITPDLVFPTQFLVSFRNSTFSPYFCCRLVKIQKFKIKLIKILTKN